MVGMQPASVQGDQGHQRSHQTQLVNLWEDQEALKRRRLQKEEAHWKNRCVAPRGKEERERRHCKCHQ